VGGTDLATAVTTAVSAASTDYTLTGNSTSITELGANGAKTLTVVIVDTAGNVSAASNNISITKDAAVPTVSLDDDHADLIVRDADTVVVEVEQEMMLAAEELRFERAAELRDKLAELRAALGEEAVGAGARG